MTAVHPTPDSQLPDSSDPSQTLQSSADNTVKDLSKLIAKLAAKKELRDLNAQAEVLSKRATGM